MAVVFGWGHRSGGRKGPAIVLNCQNCGNRTYFDLHEYKIWFTLFFIPVFPYESKNLLLCRVCEKGFNLEERHLQWARRLMELTSSWEKGQITDDEYVKSLRDPAFSVGELGQGFTLGLVSELRALPGEAEYEDEEEDTDVQTEDENIEDAIFTEVVEVLESDEPVPLNTNDEQEIPEIEAAVFCPKCGVLVPSEWRFCRKCGSKQPV